MSRRVVVDGLLKLENTLGVRFTEQQVADYLSVFESYDERAFDSAIDAACQKGPPPPSIADLLMLSVEAVNRITAQQNSDYKLRSMQTFVAMGTDPTRGLEYKRRAVARLRQMEKDFPGKGWGAEASALMRFWKMEPEE